MMVLKFKLVKTNQNQPTKQKTGDTLRDFDVLSSAFIYVLLFPCMRVC